MCGSLKTGTTAYPSATFIVEMESCGESGGAFVLVSSDQAKWEVTANEIANRHTSERERKFINVLRENIV